MALRRSIIIKFTYITEVNHLIKILKINKNLKVAVSEISGQ